MAAKVSMPYWVFVWLRSSGSPVTGVTINDVTVKFAKSGADQLTTKSVTSNDWVEVGEGLYRIKWSSQDTNTAGQFAFKVSGSGFDTVTQTFEIVDTGKPTTELCEIKGDVIDLGGEDPNTEVYFRRAAGFQIQGGKVVSGKLVRASIDSAGKFSASLIRGSEVIAEIPGAAVKHKITVPDQAEADLKDLLPLP